MQESLLIQLKQQMDELAVTIEDIKSSKVCVNAWQYESVKDVYTRLGAMQGDIDTFLSAEGDESEEIIDDEDDEEDDFVDDEDDEDDEYDDDEEDDGDDEYDEEDDDDNDLDGDEDDVVEVPASINSERRGAFVF